MRPSVPNSDVRKNLKMEKWRKIKYKRFLDLNDKKIKKELLDYNATDLERTKFIFDKLKDL